MYLVSLKATINWYMEEWTEFYHSTSTAKKCPDKDGINAYIFRPCLELSNHEDLQNRKLEVNIFSFAKCFLRILASNEAKLAEICNFWTLWPVIQLMHHLFKIQQKGFLPRQWHSNAAFFTSMDHWAKRLFVRFWKGGLLDELQARMQIFAIFGS